MNTILTLGAHAASWISAPLLETPLIDASSQLPLEMLQGRSMDVEFADLNGDDALDLIVASEFGQNLVLIAGEQGFANALNRLPRGRIHDSEDIAVGDFNLDGLPDVVFVSEDDQTNELYLQTEQGLFVDASEQLPGPGGVSNCVLALDIDQDGDQDLLVGNAGANTVFINDGDAGFTSASTSHIPAESRVTQDIEAGDLDGDGDLDLVLGNEDGPSVWIRGEDGTFANETDNWIPDLPQIEIREADLGDLDGDGDLDLVLACVGWRPGNNPRNRVLLNEGASFRDITDQTPMSGSNTLDADMIDLDNDGDLDIVLGNTQAQPAVVVWINDGNARFSDDTTEWIPGLSLVHAIDLECADLNGDGRADLYIANHISADRLLLSGG